MSASATPLRFWVKAKPGASAQRPFKTVDLPEGKKAIEVSVTAPPEDGKANDALIKRLSKDIGIPKNSIAIASGQTSRIKLIAVEAEYAEKVQTWLKDKGL